MSADFDIAAVNYDAAFTNSAIGRLQRNRVWEYLSDFLGEKIFLNVLELNCGTGEDAIFFAQNGQQVIATDISTKMLEVAQLKSDKLRLGSRIIFQTVDINQLETLEFPHQFDLIFSNFGGLNCLSPDQLKPLSKAIKKHLLPEGKFIAVVMPDFSWVETLYFLAKLQFKKMFRRRSSTPLEVNVDGQSVKTWYYSPDSFYKNFEGSFQLKAIQSIGFLPSYLEFLVKKIPLLLSMDQRLFDSQKFITASDHYLIDLELST